LARIGAEETLLHAQFEEEYEGYCRQTRWRLLPGIY
jgi:protein-S-isoprenylcysteine O-methyltransferase Ste14